MPATSKPQQRLMAAAAHGATFKKAKDLRKSMTMQQLLDYSKLAKTPKKALK